MRTHLVIHVVFHDANHGFAYRRALGAEGKSRADEVVAHDRPPQLVTTGGAPPEPAVRADLPASRISCFFILL